MPQLVSSWKYQLIRLESKIYFAFCLSRLWELSETAPLLPTLIIIIYIIKRYEHYATTGVKLKVSIDKMKNSKEDYRN